MLARRAQGEAQEHTSTEMRELENQFAQAKKDRNVKLCKEFKAKIEKHAANEKRTAELEENIAKACDDDDFDLVERLEQELVCLKIEIDGVRSSTGSHAAKVEKM